MATDYFRHIWGSNIETFNYGLRGTMMTKPVSIFWKSVVRNLRLLSRSIGDKDDAHFREVRSTNVQVSNYGFFGLIVAETVSVSRRPVFEHRVRVLFSAAETPSQIQEVWSLIHGYYDLCF